MLSPKLISGKVGNMIYLLSYLGKSYLEIIRHRLSMPYLGDSQWLMCILVFLNYNSRWTEFGCLGDRATLRISSNLLLWGFALNFPSSAGKAMTVKGNGRLWGQRTGLGSWYMKESFKGMVWYPAVVARVSSGLEQQLDRLTQHILTES